MSSEITNWEQNWRSERFKIESLRTNPEYVFFEDDDPRIELTKDNDGEPYWIIGYTSPIMLPKPHHDSNFDHVGGYVILLKVRDNSIEYVQREIFYKRSENKDK